MPTPTVTVTDVDGVRLVTWDRPEALNAFDDVLWDGTRDALLGAQADPELRCVVVTGTGRAFTAGQDLGEMLDPPAHDDGELHGYRGFIGVLEEFDKPLLAAVNGIGVGIGATILPYCDIVWIAADARLKVPFVTLGVTTEAAGSLLLPQRMGWQAAAHFIFTGSWLSAEDAVACGLAYRVSESGRRAGRRDGHGPPARGASRGLAPDHQAPDGCGPPRCRARRPPSARTPSSFAWSAPARTPTPSPSSSAEPRAWARSACRSSGCSRPTDIRTRPSVMPSPARSAGG